MTKPIRILLADDHRMVRKGFRAILEKHPEFEVIGEADNGREAVNLAEKLHPRVVIMDISMPQLNGIEATSQIIHNDPDCKVIILSMHADETYISRALGAGAKGYLLKDSAESDLISSIHNVIQGKPYFDPLIAQTLLEDYVRQLQQKGLTDSYDLLTDREKEILQLLAEGRTNKEVANLLNVSVYTVETHRTNLMQKLNLHNTAEIVLFAVRKKIIS